MKRFFLLSLVALLGLSAYADVQLAVWDQEHDNNTKTGCPAIRTWAARNSERGSNKAPKDPNVTIDCFRIFSQNLGEVETAGRATYEKFLININEVGLVIPAGNQFCLYDSDNDAWIHFSENTFPEYKGWFQDAGSVDMKFGSETTVKSLYIYRVKGETKYAISFNEDTPPEAPKLPVVGTGTSDYVLQVWDYNSAQDGIGEWNTSGGLYRVWEGVGDGEPYPIDPQYLKEDKIGGYTYKYLCFKKVEDVAAEKVAARHLLMSTSDYDEYVKIVGEGNGFEKVEDENPELYVIDFTVDGVNDGKGIYIKVPSLEDIADGGRDTDSDNPDDGIRRFFRGGIRFSFIDLRDYFKTKTGDPVDNYWANALRYVKWGHVFRLNEVARPLNAFPVFGSKRNDDPDAYNPRMLIGWQDDFGPCEWNGYDYTPLPEGQENYDKDFGVSGKQHRIAAGADDREHVSSNANKRGDSRLVSEYPFWLRKIYLQVVQDPSATLDTGDPDIRYKRFYLSFEGEYDLSASIKSEAQWSYIPPTNDNYVSETPNIFHGEKVAFNEPAFSRYYNLDLGNKTTETYEGGSWSDYLPLVGCTLSEYATYSGYVSAEEMADNPAKKGSYLYMMDYTSGYDASSKYSLLNKDGKTLAYHDVPDVKLGAEYSYKAENGKYYNSTDNSQLTTSEGLVANTKFVQAEKVSMYFDPENADYTPTDVYADYVFNFPNQIKKYTANNRFPIEYTPYDFSDEIPLSGVAVWRNKEDEGKGRYGSTIDWSEFTSHTPQTSGDNPGAFPVANYAVAHAHGESSTAPDISGFTVTEHNGRTYGASEAASWWTTTKPKRERKIENHIVETAEWINNYYVHYHLDAWYNRAYMQGGVYSDKVFEAVPAVYAITYGAVPAAADNTDVHSVDNVTVTTAPEGTTDADKAVTYQIRPVSLHGNVTVEFDDQVTAVSEVAADTDAAAPAEYYTLQGIRVDAPVPGTVCIVRRGTAVTKELIR